MKKIQLMTLVVIVLTCIMGCNNAAPVKEASAADTLPPAITNPRFTIALDEYSDISEKATELMARFDYDAWAAMLSDDVQYLFPDGDNETRTRLQGKKAVVDWWKNWQKSSGIKSMSFSESNHFPIDVTEEPKGGATKGIYDFAYFNNKLEFAKSTVSIRMNFITHFNADKKIDRIVTYYDRSKIIAAAGMNALEKK